MTMITNSSSVPPSASASSRSFTWWCSRPGAPRTGRGIL